MTSWQFYPQTRALPEHLARVMTVFDAATEHIGSSA